MGLEPMRARLDLWNSKLYGEDFIKFVIKAFKPSDRMMIQRLEQTEKVLGK